MEDIAEAKLIGNSGKQQVSPVKKIGNMPEYCCMDYLMNFFESLNLKKDFDLDESMDLQFHHTYTDGGGNTYALVRDIKETCFKLLLVLVLHGTFFIVFINHT